MGGVKAVACKACEFFTDNDNRLSMSRLMMFLSFWPATYVLIHNCTESALMVYLGAYGGIYVGGKTADIWTQQRVK